MATPTLGSLTINATKITPSRVKSVIHHSIPTRDGDRIQNMGFSSRMWNIDCDLKGLNMDTDRTTLEGYYTNDTLIPFVWRGTSYNVKIESLVIEDVLGNSYYDIKMLLVEVL